MQLASATKLQPAVQPLWKSRSKHTTMLYLLVVAKHSLLTITMMVTLGSPSNRQEVHCGNNSMYKLVLWRTISPFKQMTTWDSIFKG